MKANHDAIVGVIGQEKFDEEMHLLEKLKEQEAKSGSFQAIHGDIDRRTKEQKGTLQLAANFDQ